MAFSFQQYKKWVGLPLHHHLHSKCKQEQNGPPPTQAARDSILLNKTYWRAWEGALSHRSIIRLSADVCAKGLDLIQSGSLMLRSQKTCRWERKRQDSGGIPQTPTSGQIMWELRVMDTDDVCVSLPFLLPTDRNPQSCLHETRYICTLYAPS